jgi:membrane associated rhomboid family serine protease
MLPLTDTVRSRSFPVVNWLIIGANVAVFVLLEAPLGPRQLNQFVFTWGLVPAELFRGEPWAVLTVFSSMFLHGGWLHLISNMWALYIFGDNVEDRLGSGRYLVFYLICGVAAAFAQSAVDPGSELPLVGASGALSGVLAGYLLLFPTARVVTLIPIFLFPWFVQIPAVAYLLIWFAMQFLSGVASLGSPAAGGVAYWAHIGGFVAGLLLVRLFARRHRTQYRWYPDEHQPW